MDTSPTSGISGRYTRAFDTLIGVEGGYVNHPADRGGATKFGISLRFLKAEGKIDLNRDGRADFDLDMDGDLDGQDIRMLTVEHARTLYRRCFWDRLGCYGFARPLGEMMFDQAVNGGTSAAIRLLQRAINFCQVPEGSTTPLPGVAADGVMGPATRAGVDRVLKHPAKGMPALIVAYREMAKARYRAIAKADPSQKAFLNGWLARADQLGARA